MHTHRGIDYDSMNDMIHIAMCCCHCYFCLRKKVKRKLDLYSAQL